MNQILMITASVFMGTFAAQWAMVGIAEWLNHRSRRRHESSMREMYQRIETDMGVEARRQRAGQAN